MNQARTHVGSIGSTVLLSMVLAACGGSSKDQVEVGGTSGNTTAGVARGGSNAVGVNPSNNGGIGNYSRGGGATAGGAVATNGPNDSNAGSLAGGASARGGADGTLPGSTGAATTRGGTTAAGGTGAGTTGGAKNASATSAAGGSNVQGGTHGSNGSNVTGGAGAKGGTNAKGGATNGGGTSAKAGANGLGATTNAGGAGTQVTGGTTGARGGAAGNSTGGASVAIGGASGIWPNIRVVDNHLCDRWGKPFAVRGIESMYGSSNNASAFVAGHRALGANTLSPLPNTSASSVTSVQTLLAAAYDAGLVIGLNADHTNQGEDFFRNTQIQAIVNRYPNVFLAEAVELGSDMTEGQWVSAAKAKVDAYVGLYPDKPLKIGSPMGGRSPRYALDRCQDIVEYYYSKGGRGGLVFTCQLYWKASNASWSYQEDNGFSDGLAGILEALDAMAASPCVFMPGLDNQDDVGYTGWREIMDHVRASDADPSRRLGYQWWVYYNSGDPYDNDLTTNANDALSGITTVGLEVKAKLELDRQTIELGPLNP